VLSCFDVASICGENFKSKLADAAENKQIRQVDQVKHNNLFHGIER